MRRNLFDIHTNLDTIYSEPVQIDENVIHVDASDNGYFVTYITEEHELYGLGANTSGVLRQPVQEFLTESRQQISRRNYSLWYKNINMTYGRKYDETSLFKKQSPSTIHCGLDFSYSYFCMDVHK